MRNRENKKPPTDSPRQLNPYVLTTPFLVVVVLYLAGSFYPDRLTWGFSQWSLWTSSFVAVVFIAAAAMLVPKIAGVTAMALALPVRLVVSLFRSIGRPISVILISAVVTAVLFVWRSRALAYGDGYTILSDTAGGEDIVLLNQYYFQILSVYFNHYAYQGLSAILEWSPQDKFSLLNSIGGMVGLWAVFRIARQVTSDATSRAFVIIGSLSSASVVLFFGYIENYTWATAFALWTLSFAIGHVRKENGVVGLVVCATLAFFFHMITLPVVVVALLTLFMRNSPEGNYFLDIRMERVAVFFVLCSAVFVGVSHLLGIDVFVPFWSERGNPYSLLSSDHLMDVLNEMLLVAPLGVTLLALTALYGRKRPVAITQEDGIFCMATVLTFLVSFWIDPTIGAPRDWDLLSLYGLPLTLWGLYRFTKYFQRRAVSPAWIVPVVVVASLTLVPNLCEKQSIEQSTERLDAFLDTDPHYHTTYRLAARCMPWSVVLQQSAATETLSIKYLRRYLLLWPESYSACFSLGSVFARYGHLDSASVYLRRGLYSKPDDLQMLLFLSKVEGRLERHSEAIRWARAAVELDPGNVEALTELGVKLSGRGRPHESLPYLQRAYSIYPDGYDQQVNLGMCYVLTGVLDSGFYYIETALPRAPGKAKADLCCCLVSAALELGNLDNAVRYLDTLKRINPSYPDIPVLTKEIAAASTR